MGIIGIGVDIADVPRFAEHIERTPELLDRLLTPAETHRADGTRRSAESLAARFAAKEAVTKALRWNRTLPWQEVETVSDAEGVPHLVLRGAALERLRSLGGERMHVSLSHDAQLACAYVIAEA